MSGSIVLVMLIGWFACICFMILLSLAASSRSTKTVARRVTGAPASSPAPYADSGDH